MAANRKQSMGEAFSTIWGRGGIKGFYQGLIPWVRTRFMTCLLLLLFLSLFDVRLHWCDDAAEFNSPFPATMYTCNPRRLIGPSFRGSPREAPASNHSRQHWRDAYPGLKSCAWPRVARVLVPSA
jgi:hypothetical protein